MAQPEDGVSRRSFLKAGAATVGVLGMVDLAGAPALAMREVAVTPGLVRAGPADQPMTIVDSHCHATPAWYAEVESLIFEMDRNGVQHAVLVQIGGQFNNQYQFDAVARYPGRFANVVLTDYTKPDAVQKLEELARQGVSGVRIPAPARSPGDDPFAIWKAAARLGLSITSGGRSADFASDEFAQLAESVPGVPLVLEHLGTVNNPNDDPTPPDVRQKVFGLARFPNAHIKLHGLGEFAKRALPVTEPFPFEQPIPPLIDMAYDAFGPRRMMWGSDYPPVNGREGYRNALQLTMGQLMSKSDEDRAWIFGRTAMQVFPIRA